MSNSKPPLSDAEMEAFFTNDERNQRLMAATEQIVRAEGMVEAFALVEMLVREESSVFLARISELERQAALDGEDYVSLLAVSDRNRVRAADLEARIESAKSLIRTWTPPGMGRDRWAAAGEDVINRLDGGP